MKTSETKTGKTALSPLERIRKYLVPGLIVVLLCSAGPYIVRPVWFDESLTLDWLYYPIYKIPFKYTIPNNHIVYTVCLSAWDSAARWIQYNNIAVLRALSLVFAAVFLGLFAKRTLKIHPLPALAVGLLLTCSGAVRLFSTAIRGYMPGLCFSFAAFLCAEHWMKQTKHSCRWFVFYAVCAWLAAGTIPTNIFAIGTGLLFLLPVALRSRKDFLKLIVLGLTALAALGLFYMPIWQKFLRASNLIEGWYSASGFMGNLYGSLLFFLLPVVPFCLWGAIRLFRHKRLRLRVLCIAATLAVPLVLQVLFKAPPFPRVFFPLFGVWFLGMAYFLSGFIRGRKTRGVLVMIPVVVWILLSQDLSPVVSKSVFGDSAHDDLIQPYPITEQFVPQKAAKLLAEACRNHETDCVFVDFDADPPSIIRALGGFDIPPEVVLYDRADLGKVIFLPPRAWIVCRSPEDLQKVLRRFGIKQTYREIDCGHKDPFQRIYAPVF